MLILKAKHLFTSIVIIALLSFICLGIIGCSSNDGIPPEIEKYQSEWALANKDYSNTRATEDSNINSNNVLSLGISWAFDFPALGEWGAAATNPLIANGIVYLQDLRSNVFAIDLETGNLIWQKDYDLGSLGPNGPAIGWDKLFVAKGPYDVVALDLRTGNEMWSTRLSEIETVGIDIQLTAYNGMVYVSTVPGTSNTDFYTGGQVGIIYALDQKAGNVIWQFNTVDSEDIWGNPTVNSGGGAWYPPAIDTSTKIMYWGIGNPGPFPGTGEFPNGSSRPGPNLYTDSILALDSNDGSLLWYQQVKPHDLFDLDFQLSPILSTASISGENTEIVIGAGKLGKVYAFDRKTGEIYWETAVGEHQNDDLQEIPPDTTIRVLPGPQGGVLTPMAISDGIIYVPVVNLFADYTSTSLVFDTFDIGAGTGEFSALDVNTGGILWNKQLNSIAIGGATVINDLVFTSTLDGKIYAFDKTTGSIIWEFQAPGGINGWPAVSEDFIVIPVGMGPKPQLIALELGKGTPGNGGSVPFQADGIISSGEYDHQQKYGDYELFWKSNNTTISIGMRAKATGFVAVAIQPGTLMKDADIILGLVKDGKTEIHDMYSTGNFGPHPEDITLGGTNDISVFGGKEEGGYTIIEFQRDLMTNDEYDHQITSGINKIIWAYSQSDEIQIQHSTRGYGEIVID